MQDLFDLKYRGKYKSFDQLYDDALETMIEVLENLSSDEALEFGNMYREANRYEPLYPNEEDAINEALDGCDPYTVLNLDYDSYSDYFSYDGWDMTCTDDVWYDIDLEDFARTILDKGMRFDSIPDEVQEVIDAYDEAVEELENINEGRKMAEEVLFAYLNNNAEVGDLLVVLSKLARNDEYWSKED